MENNLLTGLDSPEKIAAAILANVGDFWERRESYETFHTRAGALWDHAITRGCQDEVSAIVVPPMRKAAP